eukprot:TRINITY_DN81634_c0_g1_i1.p1 TRINITY_DN81634_c0_g1~~TRINITY_DN81634_c0_g1_i1.p1  ORF type:complete len:292 (+),score=39.08 TRINITY_DN81634_c0_g1_i1:127-1002(+)
MIIVTALGCCCGVCCAVVGFLVAAPLTTLAAILYMLPPLTTLEAQSFPAADVQKMLPLAPPSYPEMLQGMIWMDQEGAFSESQIPLGAPDLALSFGDTNFSSWDSASRTIAVDTVGPAWQWVHRPFGYIFAHYLGMVGYHYLFEFSEDFEVAQIYPSVDLGAAGVWHVPKQLMSFTMVRRKQPPGECPPKEGASKHEWTKCASWDRVSSGLLSPLFGKFGTLHYYVFQIVDKDGQPIEPYYSAYLEFALGKAKPDAGWAERFGISVTAGETFVATRGTAAVATSDGKAAEL